MDQDILQQPSEAIKRVKPKHRSSQACQACRTRKVRCDVLKNGARCTNCRLDMLDCIVLASRRGKTNHRSHNRASQSGPAASSRPARLMVDSDPDPTSIETQTSRDAIITPTGSNVDAGGVPACVTFDEDVDNEVNELPSTREVGSKQSAEHMHPEPYDQLLTPGLTAEPSEQYHSPIGTTLPSLPAFIAPLSTRISSEDVDFLVRKGAFLMPEPDLQLEIIHSYMFSVHPFMPMLDSRDFISAILSDGEQGKVSLLLFQAVMFAGVHSLQSAVVHRLGLESTKQAREVFFSRVRLLYDFDIEPNSAAILQSLLLMSSWYSKWHERRHTWHWTGLAYDLARNMGLHREPSRRHASEKVCRFRRRLWWSLYIRDRMIALGTRRPMRIRDDEWGVEMLTLDDFDVQPFDRPNDQIKSLVQSKDEATSTALMCIQLAKLSICIGHVVSSQYTTLNTQTDVPHTMMVVSKRGDDALKELEDCDKELDEWLQNLSDNVQRHDSHAQNLDPQSCSEVHWAILNLTHLTTVNVLHRAQALRPSDLAGSEKAQKSSRSKVKDAARGMTRLTQTMLHNDQARFLSLIGVTALIAACLSHMLDINSSDEDVRDASTLRLCQSVQVLQYMRGIYASADAAASFVASLTGQAGISMPPQATGFATAATRPSQNSLQQRTNIISSSITPAPREASTHLWQSKAPNGLHTPRSANISQQHQRAGATELFAPAISRSTDGASQQDTASNYAGQEQDIFQIDTTFGGPLNLSNGQAFDWAGNPEASMDLGLMSFNYDFYSDAFGFFDQHDRGIQ